MDVSSKKSRFYSTLHTVKKKERNYSLKKIFLGLIILTMIIAITSSRWSPGYGPVQRISNNSLNYENMKDNVEQSITSRSNNIFIGDFHIVQTHQGSTFLQYAVFSSSLKQDTYMYSFDLPLTIKAWRRLGYGSIIILTGGTFSDWISHPVLNITLEQAIREGVILVFAACPDHQQVMMAQVSRIFAASIVPADLLGNGESTLLTTADADLWPLKKEPYVLPSNKKIMCTNSECCQNFVFKNKSYKMVPLSTITMSIATWREVIMLDNVREMKVIVEKIRSAYGNKAVDESVPIRAENHLWYMDQEMVSVHIALWEEQQNHTGLVEYRPRNMNTRIGRDLGVVRSIDHLIDVHLPDYAWTLGVWPSVLRLLKLMYDTKSVDHLEKYRQKFKLKAS